MKGVCAKGWQGNLQGTLMMMMLLLFAARPLSRVKLYRKMSAGEAARLQLQDERGSQTAGGYAHTNSDTCSRPSVKKDDGMRSRQW